MTVCGCHFSHWLLARSKAMEVVRARGLKMERTLQRAPRIRAYLRTLTRTPPSLLMPPMPISSSTFVSSEPTMPRRMGTPIQMRMKAQILPMVGEQPICGAK